MALKVATVESHAHLLRAENGPSLMAKADLRKAETPDWRVLVGRAVERAQQRRGWSLKEFADAIGRDQRQLARWINGKERPQFDALLAEPTYGPLLVVSLAEIPGSGIVITTQLTVARAA